MPANRDLGYAGRVVRITGGSSADIAVNFGNSASTRITSRRLKCILPAVKKGGHFIDVTETKDGLRYLPCDWIRWAF